MLRVGASTIEGAGQGLFANRRIDEGALVKVAHGRPKATPDNSGENLEYFVMQESDSETPCVVKGELRRFADVRTLIHRTAYTPRYIVGSTTDPLMKANDRAWPATSATQYAVQARANALEFVLSFDTAGRVDGVFGHFRRAVSKDEEIGATYGWAYWIESK